MVRVGGDRGVHDRVDPGPGDDLADERAADVGADELGASEQFQVGPPGRCGVHADHAVDGRIGGQAAGQPATQVLADAGDQNRTSHSPSR